MLRLRLFALLLALSGAVAAFPQQPAGVWLDVPFVKQTEEGCGSASVAMLLQYWNEHGKTILPARSDAALIQAQLYSRKQHGIFASDLQQYLASSGFRVFAVTAEWNDLRKHLSAGRPLIVVLQPNGKNGPLHYVVVSGLDWEHDQIFLNDPARGKLVRLPRAEFEKRWQSAGSWMLLAVPETSG
jgi:predicted double-glycine peptidase